MCAAREDPADFLRYAAEDAQLGARLVGLGRLTMDELERCFAIQGRRGGAERVRLRDILVERGVVQEAEIVGLLAHPGGSKTGTPAGAASPAPEAACSPAIPVTAFAEATPAHGPGMRIGRFVVQRLLGRGAAATVLEARDPDQDRVVALKVLALQPRPSPKAVRRFIQEGRMAERLDHPGIVKVYEAGEHEGQPWIAMEAIEGRDLEAWWREDHPAWRDQVEVLSDVARALAHAHRRGVIHRDLKPQNVILDPQGWPHITDFGLARDVSSMTSLTGTGEVLGTPYYMAPEQAEGESREVGPEADVYALGAVLYHGLAGRPPYDGLKLLEFIQAVVGSGPAPLGGLAPALPEPLIYVVERCMARAPAARFPTAADLAYELERVLVDVRD